VNSASSVAISCTEKSVKKRVKNFSVVMIGVYHFFGKWLLKQL
jgi:hypothetical protein